VSDEDDTGDYSDSDYDIDDTLVSKKSDYMILHVQSVNADDNILLDKYSLVCW